MKAWLALGALGIAACGDNTPGGHDYPYFTWTGQREVGAMSLDHLTPTTDLPMLGDFFEAADDHSVVMIYGHVPGQTFTLDTLESVLAAADAEGLAYYTFADLAAGTAQGRGLCLSFDDAAIHEWMTMRDVFARHGAHASFFVTRYAQWTPEERALLHELYADGHSVEAHGVSHVDGRNYAAAFGVDAYVATQVMPSLDVLRADGFTPVAFAHPYGRHSPAIDAALEPLVPITRGIAKVPLPGRP